MQQLSNSFYLLICHAGLYEIHTYDADATPLTCT